ncbi:unnamed protein product [Absidia cylindrospora]
MSITPKIPANEGSDHGLVDIVKFASERTFHIQCRSPSISNSNSANTDSNSHS